MIHAVTRFWSSERRNTSSGSAAGSTQDFSSGSAPPAIATTWRIARPAAAASSSARRDGVLVEEVDGVGADAVAGGDLDPVERHDVVAARQQRLHERRAEPAGGTGDEDRRGGGERVAHGLRC